jgi:hypothetical protein
VILLDTTNAACDFCDGETQCVCLQSANTFADDTYICMHCTLKVLGLFPTQGDG